MKYVPATKIIGFNPSRNRITIFYAPKNYRANLDVRRIRKVYLVNVDGNYVYVFLYASNHPYYDAVDSEGRRLLRDAKDKQVLRYVDFEYESGFSTRMIVGEGHVTRYECRLSVEWHEVQCVPVESRRYVVDADDWYYIDEELEELEEVLESEF